MTAHDEKTDPHGFPPPSDPQADAARLFATMVGDAIDARLGATNRAIADVANLVTRDHVVTSRRLAMLEATRLAPAFAAIVLSIAAFGLAAVSAARPAQAAQHCPEVRP